VQQNKKRREENVHATARKIKETPPQKKLSLSPEVEIAWIMMMEAYDDHVNDDSEMKMIKRVGISKQKEKRHQ